MKKKKPTKTNPIVPETFPDMVTAILKDPVMTNESPASAFFSCAPDKDKTIQRLEIECDTWRKAHEQVAKVLGEILRDVRE